MKALGNGQNGANKEHPARHFEIASLAATAFLKITSAHTKSIFFSCIDLQSHLVSQSL